MKIFNKNEKLLEIKYKNLLNNLTIRKFDKLKFAIKKYKFEYNQILKIFLLFIELNDLKSGKY